MPPQSTARFIQSAAAAIPRLTDSELLVLVLGRKRARETNFQGSLAPLFLPGSGALILQAAAELIFRALAEDLAHKSVLSSPEAVKRLLLLHFHGQAYESFVVLFLDAQNGLIVIEDMFRGTLTQTSVYPREIVKRALELSAASVVLAHNHPSGCTKPSRADEALTQTLRQALALVDVRVLDHIVVGASSTTSFAEVGLL